MIRRIELQFFKCFELLRLPLDSLTLLSGANASGKSTALQPIVLLHQTIRKHEWSTRLMLNGDVIRLGTVTDIVDQLHSRRSCGVALWDEETPYRWEFEGERDEMSMKVKSVSIGDDWKTEPETLRYLLPPSAEEQSPLTRRLRDLTYLTAERLGPRETYLLEDPGLTSVVGSTGEHAASVLYSCRDNQVSCGLRIEDVAPTLWPQVEARMAQFFPGCRLDIQKIPHVNALTLGIRTSNAVDFHRPVHTGFGLTQVLPIVVAALSAEADALLLIENPEVHLHPAGQAAMGEFLSRVAATGVQVILESHSDHVLNGVRRAVKDGVLTSGDVALHFFRSRQEDDDNLPQLQSPALDANGNIDTWPAGFFDQFDKDMNYFAGWEWHEPPGQ